MSFSSRAAASVQRLIRHTGGDFAVSIPTWINNPGGAGTVRGTPAAKTVRGALMSTAQGESRRTDLQRDEVEILLLPHDTSGVAYALEKDAYVTVDGRKLLILDPGPCQPAGTVLYYRAKARQEA